MAKSKTGTKSKIQKPPPASASAPPVAEKKQPDVVDDAPQDGFGGLGEFRFYHSYLSLSVSNL